MPKLPVVSGVEFVKALVKAGYEVTNHRGDHVVLRYRRDDPSTAMTVPLHRELKKGTLNTLVKHNEKITGMARDELLKML